jgi:hypothetical protein
MSIQDVLQRIILALDQAGIAYMLSGSFASAYYGASRSTQDIDFVIHASSEQLRSFIGALPVSEYYADLDSALEAHQRQSMFNVIDQATGWKIDFIIRKSRSYSQEEFRRRQRVTLHGVAVFMTTAEDAIISKLEWAKRAHSGRQIEDVAAILRVRWETLDKAYLVRCIAELGLETEWGDAQRAAGISD